MNEKQTNNISNSEYESLILNNIENNLKKEKSIVDGTVVSIENDMVIVDVGLKSEGRIPLTEFARVGKNHEIEIGEKLSVYIENIDNSNGETILSREKAVKQSAWNNLQDCFDNEKVVTGTPFNRVKGGMSVDLNGVIAFLPGSQIDSRQIVRDTKELLNKPIDLMILKMDKFRGNIVVSRKAISDVELKEQRAKLLENIEEGSDLEGKIKNLTDYGAFVDLGGIDGLVHVTDISWNRINHPSEVLELGATVTVKVLKFDQELSRLSLGIKQLTDDPWSGVKDNFVVEQSIKCPISSINDQGVSVLVDGKYDGFIPINELTWLKKPPHPSKVVQVKDEVEVKILEIDDEKRRFLFSLKQLKENPWASLSSKFNMGDSFDTEIVNVVDFGIFVKVHQEIDGMIHVSDLSWDENECTKMLSEVKKGDPIKVKILDINVEKERISLGLKQLNNDPIEAFIQENPIRSKVTGKISLIDDRGISVILSENINGYIKKINLSKDKLERKTDRFAIDEKIDSMIISINSKTRIINLSIKEIEIEDEKSALTKYGSNESGASLGDILGSALSKKNNG